MPKERKKRRSGKDLEDIIIDATTKCIKENGFHGVTLTGIAKIADIEPPVLYKRYKDLADLLDKYVRQYDYWLHDIISLEEQDGLSSKQNMKNILVGLVDALYENPIMQELLKWEISSKDNLAKRTAICREVHSKPLLKYFTDNLQGNIEFKPVTALLISSIYYLILHKDVSEFCEIDFSTSDGKERLKDTQQINIWNKTVAKIK